MSFLSSIWSGGTSRRMPNQQKLQPLKDRFETIMQDMLHQ